MKKNWPVLTLGAALLIGLVALAKLIISVALRRPGAWMEVFKQFMGFLLMGTLAWLLWLLGRLVGVDAQAWGMLFLLGLSLSAWAFC